MTTPRHPPSHTSARRLTGDSLSLLLSSGSTAALGLAFWFAATRLFPAAAVGQASTAINAALVLATVATLSLGPLYERFLPAAGRRQPRLIAAGHLAVAGLAAALAAGYLLLGPSAALFPGPGDAAVFIAAVVTLALFSVQDGTLIGVGAARWAAAKNLGHAVAKLLALLALAAVGTGTALLLSWVVPALLAVLAAEALLLAPRGGLARRDRGRAAALPPPAQLGRFSALSLVWLLAQAAPGLIVPALVVDGLGLAAAAHFNVAWSIVTASLTLMSLALGPLVAAGARPGANRAALSAAAIRLLVWVSLVRGLGVGALGPLALRLAGPEYAADGAGLLVLLGLCHLISGPAGLYGALARIDGRIGYPVAVQAIGSAGLIWLVAAWLPAAGITAVGWAFLAHDLFVLAAALPRLLRLLRRDARGVS